MDALEAASFVVPEKLRQLTNIKRDKYYDQIAFRLDEGGPAGPSTITHVSFFPDDKLDANASDDDKKKYFKTWRTWQMSDHLPLWVELDIDYGDEYLRKISNG